MKVKLSKIMLFLLAVLRVSIPEAARSNRQKAGI